MRSLLWLPLVHISPSDGNGSLGPLPPAGLGRKCYWKKTCGSPVYRGNRGFRAFAQAIDAGHGWCSTRPQREDSICWMQHWRTTVNYRGLEPEMPRAACDVLAIALIWGADAYASQATPVHEAAKLGGKTCGGRRFAHSHG